MYNFITIDAKTGKASPKAAVSNARTLLELSSFLRERGSNPELDIAAIAASEKALLNLATKKRINDIQSVFIRLGDRAPIFLGGWAVYQHELSKHGDQKRAIAAMEDVAAATQQTADLDELSAYQRASGAVRMLTMFASAPLALARGEVRAIRQFARGKITPFDFGKRMAIYHIIIPTMYTAVASSFNFDDEEEYKVALALGSLNGLIGISEILGFAARNLFDADLFRLEKTVVPFKVMGDMARGVAAALEADSADEYFDALKDLAKATGAVTGIGVEGLIAKAEGLADASPRRFMGWSERVIEGLDN